MAEGKCGWPNAFLSPEGLAWGRHLADPDLKSHSTLGQGVKVGVSISHRGGSKAHFSALSLSWRALPAREETSHTATWQRAGVKGEGHGRVAEAGSLQLAHLSLPFHAHSNLSKMQSLSYREQSLLRR